MIPLALRKHNRIERRYINSLIEYVYCKNDPLYVALLKRFYCFMSIHCMVIPRHPAVDCQAAATPLALKYSPYTQHV